MDRIEKIFFVVDFLWSLFVIFPLLVVFWGGTWGLMDIYFQNATNEFCSYALKLDQNHQNTNNSGKLTTCGASISIGVGVFLCLFFFYLLPVLGSMIRVNNRSPVHVLVSRLCIYFFAFGGLFFWRGIWIITDMLIGWNMNILIGTTVAAEALLILSRSSANAIGTPFVLGLDTCSDFYETYPRFRQKPDNLKLYTADVLLTVFVIQTLNVIVWVGLWDLGDALILPNSTRLVSFAVCIAAGYAASIIIFLVQTPFYSFVFRLAASRRWLSLAVEDLYNILLTVVVLLLWRGLWGILKLYLVPDGSGPLLIWICHVVGFFATIGLQVGTTLARAGCAVDGEHTQPMSWRLEYFGAFYRDYQLQNQTNVNEERRVIREDDDDDDDSLLSDVQPSDAESVNNRLLLP